MRETVVYDGDCGICEWSAGWIRRYVTDVDAVSHTIYGVEHLDAVWFITNDGRHMGALAISAILKRSTLKTARWAGALVDAPGCRLVAQGVYFVIAKNRRRLSKLLGLTACPLPGR